MKPRIVILVLLVATAVLWGWLRFRADDGANTLDTRAGPVDQTGASPRRAEPDGDPSTPDAATARKAPPVDLSELPRGAHAVVVVDGPTQKRVGGAVVHMLTRTDLGVGEVDRMLRQRRDVDAILRDRGTRYVADADGVVALPPFDGTAFFRATHDGLHSSIDEHSSVWAGWIVLELWEYVRFRVRAVDPGGAVAAGVPVATVVWNPPSVTFVDHAMTDAAGVATFLIRADRVREMSPSRDHFMAAFPALDAPRVPVPLQQAEEEVIELPLPETGAVEVNVFLSGSFYSDGTCEVSVGPGPGNGIPDFVRNGPHWLRECQGGTVFSHVGLGVPLIVGCGPHAPGFSRHSVHADGPRVPGEKVIVNVELPLPSPSITAIATDATGEPLVRTSLRVGAVDGSDVWLDATVETDDEGRFGVGLGGRAGSEQGIAIDVRESWPGDRPPRAATIRLDAVRDGVTDVGVVALDTGEIVASGSVTDHRGDPVPDAAILVHKIVESVEEDGSEAVDYVSLEWMNVSTDANGLFEARGNLPGGKIVLTVEADGAGVRSDRLSPGATNVRLVLPARCRLLWPVKDASRLFLAGHVEARLRGLPAAAPRDPLEVDLDEKAVRDARLGKEGFEWDGLRPGTCDVILRWVDDRRPIATLRNVVVGPSGTTLSAIDLERHVSLTRLRIDRRPAPQTRRDRQWYVVVRRDGRWRQIRMFHDSEVLLPLEAPPEEIVVQTARHGMARVRDVSDVVVMRRIDPVECAVDLAIDEAVGPIERVAVAFRPYVGDRDLEKLLVGPILELDGFGSSALRRGFASQRVTFPGVGRWIVHSVSTWPTETDLTTEVLLDVRPGGRLHLVLPLKRR